VGDDAAMPMKDDLATLHEQLAVLQREVERSREQARRFEQLEAENAALRAKLEKLERELTGRTRPARK
jgi:cell division protein FtsB